MPLTLFEGWLSRRMDDAQRARLQAWTYRIGIYVVINLLDEPVWLALMFC